MFIGNFKMPDRTTLEQAFQTITPLQCGFSLDDALVFRKAEVDPVAIDFRPIEELGYQQREMTLVMRFKDQEGTTLYSAPLLVDEELTGEALQAAVIEEARELMERLTFEDDHELIASQKIDSLLEQCGVALDGYGFEATQPKTTIPSIAYGREPGC